MNPDTTPVITFVGASGTGKTTFLEKLIPLLKGRGLRLAVLKHDAHHFEMDKPGKDTYRFTAAGADAVTISNREKFALIEQPEGELSLRDIIARLPPVDLVLTEGYKQSANPKIEIHRAVLNRPLLAMPEQVLCVMTDEPLDTPSPQLPLEDVEGCVRVILRYLREFRRPDAGETQRESMEPLLISACLLGVNCKYSGGNNLCPGAEALAGRYHLIPVCPEQLGGLPTPRPSAEIREDRVVNNRGEDVTEAFCRGAAEALALAEQFGCKRAVLKARSPSCGAGEIYDGTFSGTVASGDGMTARLLRERGLRLYTEEELEKLV